LPRESPSSALRLRSLCPRLTLIILPDLTSTSTKVCPAGLQQERAGGYRGGHSGERGPHLPRAGRGRGQGDRRAVVLTTLHFPLPLPLHFPLPSPIAPSMKCSILSALDPEANSSTVMPCIQSSSATWPADGTDVADPTTQVGGCSITATIRFYLPQTRTGGGSVYLHLEGARAQDRRLEPAPVLCPGRRTHGRLPPALPAILWRSTTCCVWGCV
jgi:hypothetical protein